MTITLNGIVVSGVANESDAPLTTEQLLEEVLTYLKAVLLALSLTAHGESFTPEEILAQTR